MALERVWRVEVGEGVRKERRVGRGLCVRYCVCCCQRRKQGREGTYGVLSRGVVLECGTDHPECLDLDRQRGFCVCEEGVQWLPHL